MYAESLMLVTFLADKGPDAEDVKAGPLAGGVGVPDPGRGVLGFSLVKRLRNVERAEDEGLYDPSTKRQDKPADWPTTEEPKE